MAQTRSQLEESKLNSELKLREVNDAFVCLTNELSAARTLSATKLSERDQHIAELEERERVRGVERAAQVSALEQRLKASDEDALDKASRIEQLVRTCGDLEATIEQTLSVVTTLRAQIDESRAYGTQVEGQCAELNARIGHLTAKFVPLVASGLIKANV